MFTVNSVLFEDSHFRGFRGSHQTTKVGIRRKLVTLDIFVCADYRRGVHESTFKQIRNFS